MTAVSRRLLLIWLVAIVLGTLAPFNFSLPAGGEHALKLFEYGSYQQDPFDFLLNVLMFVPLGALLHHDRHHRSHTLMTSLCLAGVVGLVISATIEYLQAYVPLRDSSLIDVMANAGGAVIGVGAGKWWGAAVVRHVDRLRARTSSPVLAGLMVGFLVVTLVISGILQMRTRLSNWSDEYPLLVGNESTGDRPWRGQLFALEMRDQATPLAAARRFAAGDAIPLPGMAVATFDFNGHPPFTDTATHQTSLEWTDPAGQIKSEPGVTLAGRSWLRSAGPVPGLTARLRETNAFTLRVDCATEDIDQHGPARIVSNSPSPLLRNFTLSQEGSDLVFRLRTPETGVNGYPLEFVLPGVFADRRLHQLLVTYDGASLIVASAHDGDVSRTELNPGSNIALAIPAWHVRAQELQLYGLAYVAGLSLVPGILIGLLGHTSRIRQLFGAAWVVAFTVLFEVTLVWVSGRAFHWSNLADNAAVGAVVLTVIGVTLSQPDMQWRRSARAWWLAPTT